MLHWWKTTKISSEFYRVWHFRCFSIDTAHYACTKLSFCRNCKSELKSTPHYATGSNANFLVTGCFTDFSDRTPCTLTERSEFSCKLLRTDCVIWMSVWIEFNRLRQNGQMIHRNAGSELLFNRNKPNSALETEKQCFIYGTANSIPIAKVNCHIACRGDQSRNFISTQIQVISFLYSRCELNESWLPERMILAFQWFLVCHHGLSSPDGETWARHHLTRKTCRSECDHIFCLCGSLRFRLPRFSNTPLCTLPLDNLLQSW